MSSPRPHFESSPQRRHRARARAGFTLLELMVALTAGIIVIGIIYFVGAASARHFHEQQRIAQTQMNVRMAMEQLRRDIERAGFLGVPNSGEVSTCGATPGFRLQGIEVLEGADTDALPNASSMGVTADRLRLSGNYVTGDAYRVRTLDASGTRLYLQRNWHAFERDFGIIGASGDHAFRADDFQRVFRVGRYLHIENVLGNHFFVRITGVTPSSASVTFTPSLSIGGTCVGGLADQATVAPLSRVEYLATDITDSSEFGTRGDKLQPVGGRVAEDSDFRGQTATQLVRREIDFAAPGAASTEQAGTERIVLEYLAHIDYQLVYDTQAGTVNPPNLQVAATGTSPDAEQLTVTNDDAERVQSVIVTLAGRTAEQDPRFPWPCTGSGSCAVAGNGAEQPPTRYQVNPNATGAARVRVLRDEVFLPNMAGR